jgi:opacity protein-like surface antigen
MFVRAEYRYNNFSSVNLASVTSKFDQDVINVGVGIKF